METADHDAPLGDRPSPSTAAHRAATSTAACSTRARRAPPDHGHDYAVAHRGTTAPAAVTHGRAAASGEDLDDAPGRALVAVESATDVVHDLDAVESPEWSARVGHVASAVTAG